MPLPNNRGVTGRRDPRPLVRLIDGKTRGVILRARVHLAEHDSRGEVQRFEPGDTLEVSEERARALAHLTEPVKPEAARPA